MLAPQEIDRHVKFIECALDDAETPASHDSPSRSAAIGIRFGLLRSQYRASPQSMALHSSRLRELRARFDAGIASHLTAVVDRFHEINSLIRELEEERECWRDVLISQSGINRRNELAGASATAYIRAARSREIPPTGSADRKQLEQALLRAGDWDLVSQLSRSRLTDAFEKHALSRPAAEAVDELCPARLTQTLSSRPINSNPGGRPIRDKSPQGGTNKQAAHA